jgi:hypothetical protein
MLGSFSAQLVPNVVGGALCALGGAALTRVAGAVRLDDRLTGRWEGDLRGSGAALEEFPTHVIHWVLVLARPSARQNSGFVYYWRECTQTDAIIAKGVDELDDYARSNGIGLPPQCELRFVRRLHKPINAPIDTSPRPYGVRCRFGKWWARGEKLYVEIAIVNGQRRDTWEGVLQKQ